MVEHSLEAVQEIGALIAYYVDRLISDEPINKILAYSGNEEGKRAYQQAQQMRLEPAEGIKRILRERFHVEPDEVVIWQVSVEKPGEAGEKHVE